MEPHKKSKSFSAGDVIQDWVKPLFKILMPEQKKRRCTNCFKTPQDSEDGFLKCCSACKINYYCSARCQKEDWDFAHRVECKLSLFCSPIPVVGKGLGGDDSYWNWLVARILAHFKQHPEEEVKEHEIYDGTTRSFSTLLEAYVKSTDGGSLDLMAPHVNSNNKRDLDLMAEQMSACIIRQDPNWSAAYIRKIVGMWITSCSELMSGDDKIGVGFFVETAVFDHSCRPTAFAVRDISDQWRIQIRAIADIPPGAQPLISYLPGLMSRDRRQAHLKLGYNFECRCDLCEEEKAGPAEATDYEELRKFDKNYQFMLAKLAMLEGVIPSFETIVHLRDKVLRLYSPLYHPYDERVTLVATRVFSFLLQNYSNLKVRSGAATGWSKLANDTLKRIRMTYGVEHISYTSCKACLNQLGIKVSE